MNATVSSGVRRRPAARPRAAPRARVPRRMSRPVARRPKQIVRRPVRVPRPIPSMRYHPLAHAWHFDPMDKRLSLPSSDAVGDFLSVDGVVRSPLTTNAVSPQYLILQWTATHVRALICDGATGTLTFLPTPQIQTANPTSVRAERESLRLRISSVFTSIQGTVRVLSTPQQLIWSFTTPVSAIVDAPFLTRLGNMMSSHPSVRSFAGAEFLKTQAFITPPASNSGFKSYAPFFIPATNDQLQAALIDGAIQTSTNLMVVQFNTTTVAQTYDLAIHTQTASRFSANVLYSNLVQAPLHIDANMEHRAVTQLQHDSGRAFDEAELAAAAGGPIWNARQQRSTPYGVTG